MIHTSHSKKDLIEFIETFEMWDIIDYHDLSKDELRREIWENLRGKRHIATIPENNFFIESIPDLMKYLNTPCPKQFMTKSKETEIHDKSQNIIFYSRECSHIISASNFKDMDEIIQTANEVAIYGDLPIVRKALNLLNKDGKVNDKINPIMTRRVEKQEYKKKQLKIRTTGGLKVITGKVVVIFDE